MPDDKDELTEFALAHGRSLKQFAVLLCGDHGVAEDLVQNAYLALFRRFGRRLPLDSPLAYARRAIVNANASRTRLRSHGEFVLADLPDAPVTDGVDLDAKDAMRRALADLPERQRTVLVCRYYLDLPDSEIAEMLGVRASTVRSLATRAFSALRTRTDLTFRSVTR